MRATGLVAALALLWGSGYFWIKLALGGFTPLQLTFGRLALGALVLLPIVLIRRLRGPATGRCGDTSLSRRYLRARCRTRLFAVAEQTVSSSLAGVLNATTPLWTVILAVSLRHRGATVPASDCRRARRVRRRRRRCRTLVRHMAGSVLGILACLAAALSYASLTRTRVDTSPTAGSRRSH